MEDFITRLFTELEETWAVITSKFNWLDANKANKKLDNLPGDLTNTEKTAIRNKIDAAGITDISGLLFNPAYDSATHVFKMDMKGGGSFTIDFPIENLIENIELDDDNNLVLTFEDGTTVDVPLNALLVGVVKNVNGKTPNSSGVVTIGIGDIANLQATLDAKAMANLSNLPSNLSAAEKTAIRNKIGAGTGSGSVTSVGMSVPTGFSVTGSPVTSSGTLALSFATGYSLPTTAKQSNWDKAYQHSLDMGDANVGIPDWSTELENQINF